MRATPKSRRQLLAAVFCTALLVSGCGFTVRGPNLGLPFKAMAISGPPGVTEEIRWLIQGQPSIKLVEKTTDAEVAVTVQRQWTERTVVGFNAAGRPREIQLRLRVIFKFSDRYGVDISSLQEIALAREFSLSEAEALASAATEAFMLEDMQKDIAYQIVRRLRAVKLPG